MVISAVRVASNLSTEPLKESIEEEVGEVDEGGKKEAHPKRGLGSERL
jgi:hypothetical protein